MFTEFLPRIVMQYDRAQVFFKVLLKAAARFVNQLGQSGDIEHM